MKTPSRDDVLVILAVLGVFASFNIIGRVGTPYFWPKLAVVVGFSTTCLLLTRTRGARDTFLAVVGALFALMAIAMTTGDRAYPNWWPLFLGGC
jgi:hypothetical protein